MNIFISIKIPLLIFRCEALNPWRDQTEIWWDVTPPYKFCDFEWSYPFFRASRALLKTWPPIPVLKTFNMKSNEICWPVRTCQMQLGNCFMSYYWLKQSSTVVQPEGHHVVDDRLIQFPSYDKHCRLRPLLRSFWSLLIVADWQSSQRDKALEI